VNNSIKNIAVIGGGAAGFFSAIHAAEKYADAEVSIFEKQKKLLSKVRISGGGRCNVTNAAGTIAELLTAYPRGGRFLKKAFHRFSNRDAMAWFRARGVPLTVQEDRHVFPESQNSGSIIDCFLGEAEKYGIKIHTGAGICRLTGVETKWLLEWTGEHGGKAVFDRVIVACGGMQSEGAFGWLKDLGQPMIPVRPSLFTFNIEDAELTALSGTTVERVQIGFRVGSRTFSEEGILLITHWGISGPAVLKLSAFGARELADAGYRVSVQLNWTGQAQDEIRRTLADMKESFHLKQMSNTAYPGLSLRLWHYLLKKSGIEAERRWAELSRRDGNRLLETLTAQRVQMTGKSTFKEEFVSSGGIDLKGVDALTMQSRIHKGLYFAGEILDIDGITGGYNFQAAWTTGYIAGQLED